MPGEHLGLAAATRYPLFRAIFNRRSRRISKGIASVPAGSLSYESTQKAEPLSALEEALLISATGITGVTMPDMPFETPEGKKLLGSPMIAIRGRAASSPDNAQATHFFMVNDSGTYLLKPPDETFSDEELSHDGLIRLAERTKIKVSSERVEFPRHYPFYIGRNKFVSNLPGTTIFVPVVDLTRQYINGILYLLSQDEGLRPAFRDDWNFYRYAGVRHWVRRGFLNEDLPLPLGYLGTFRIHVEADLLVQNLLLAIQAMGLGGWVHAAFAGPMLLGDPDYADKGRSLGFRHETPRKWLRRLLPFFTPLPAWRPNPVGLDGLLEGLCPPYVANMSEAVDALIEEKYGEGGLYRDPERFRGSFKGDLAERFLKEVPHYSPAVIQCTKDVCNYIYDSYGRFPAHVDAMYVPGIWVQAHHLDLDYYDTFYENGVSDSHREHDALWHGGTPAPAESVEDHAATSSGS